ncbi:arylsulfatase [Cryomorpha ignava]|uniref:Arylsulfatase n=1 Tax=Cryomorpha ignava TaxID=101383 RepID=A0A7K3WU84_9FLAO|nr:arylsulfatase [Cryomorpha ignava]NEN25064.1 arylsulfatase [Cryomorpha ignava]
MNKVILIFLGLFAVSQISCAQAQSSETKPQEARSQNAKPNIVYILADDLGYGDLSSYGQKKFNTPNIDALAEKGIKFTQHYSGSTVCAPSRSALITGLHTGHTTVRGNEEIQPEGQYPINDSDFTIAELLKEAGYTTGAFGKWGLGPVGSSGDPINQGFDVFYGYNCQRMSHSYYPFHLWDNDQKVVLDENSGSGEGVYAPNLIHQKALAFIDANKDKPFFLFYPSTIPHAELAAPEEYIAKYREKFAPDKAYFGVDEGPRYKMGGYSSQPETHATFAAMVTLLDDEVGEIVAKLEELGIANNTLIIFTSDNGPHKEGGADPDFFNSNGPLKGYKRDLYEGGLRVPMVARWDGVIKPSTETDHISAFWDLMPTFADIANVDAPETTDGISFLNALKGQPQDEHAFLYWEFPERGGSQAVRMGKWKGVRSGVNRGFDSPIELYDLSTDLGEKKNIANQNQAIVDSIVTIMQNAHMESAVFPFKFEQKE